MGGGGGERPGREDTMVTKRLIQRTLTGTTVEIKCQCGSVYNSLRGLNLHQVSTKCGSGKKQRNRTVLTDETKKDHIQEEHHSAEDLLKLLRFEEEQVI